MFESAKDARVAFVTGASRGIGRAVALALAEAGFDVALTARTLQEGEGRDDSDAGGGVTALPGSLASTAAAVRERGRRALPIRADMLDRAALDAAVSCVVAEWGRIDVLVNNAMYLPGTSTRILALDPQLLDRSMLVNASNALYLVQKVLPGMLKLGGGRIINIASPSGSNDPLRPPELGGWGVSYGMSKAALERIAGAVMAEHADDGIVAYTLSVQAVTERSELHRGAQSFVACVAPPASWIGRVVSWLALGGEGADRLAGRLVHATDVIDAYGLCAPERPLGAAAVRRAGPC